MREILFRGKRTDNGKWVTGLLARYNPKYEIANMVTDFDVLVPAYNKTVGQYTDLTDKNGKKIFEGDIVKYKNSSPCQIAYIDSQFVMMWKNFYRNFEQVYDDEIEVIGNIHDNPELLEVQK